MLTFKINEIPKGKSTDKFEINERDLDLRGLEFRALTLNMEFEKREFTLLVTFHFDAEVQLICDRSLDEYWQPLTGSYSILFKVDAQEESEDDQMSVRRLDISGNIINIENEVRDTILLAVPLKKIHPRYFDKNGELIELELPKEASDEIDPRWEALKNLKETNL
ncbi:MAG TPA: DUF177 domain-containing protein [Bacteroidetes bacterium]|nr:DUF177 domain-containing protein [Bacteroidota bacterium]